MLYSKKNRRIHLNFFGQIIFPREGELSNLSGLLKMRFENILTFLSLLSTVNIILKSPILQNDVIFPDTKSVIIEMVMAQ